MKDIICIIYDWRMHRMQSTAVSSCCNLFAAVACNCNRPREKCFHCRCVSAMCWHCNDGFCDSFDEVSNSEMTQFRLLQSEKRWLTRFFFPLEQSEVMSRQQHSNFAGKTTSDYMLGCPSRKSGPSDWLTQHRSALWWSDAYCVHRHSSTSHPKLMSQLSVYDLCNSIECNGSPQAVESPFPSHSTCYYSCIESACIRLMSFG